MLDGESVKPASMGPRSFDRGNGVINPRIGDFERGHLFRWILSFPNLKF